MNCRFCHSALTNSVVSLGNFPLANTFLDEDELSRTEHFYPLDLYLCDKCYLVQLPEYEKPEKIFTIYPYFSSYSSSWLKHSENYVNNMVERFGLDKQSFVTEVASNDGYLLQYFIRKGISVLGVEPAENIAKVARKKGVPTEVAFFGTGVAGRLVAEGRIADLIIANNVLAHVPEINDFIAGLKIMLAPDGVITLEFPHLMTLIQDVQFDPIYHEHFSYFSFLTVEKVFDAHGLTLFDVEELPTHGGSLRIYAGHKEGKTKDISQRVFELRQKEEKAGYTKIDFCLSFEEKVKAVKRNILAFLIQAKEEGKNIAGYGAPAKGNTLLNYCGIKTDFIDYTVDRNPYKQGCYLPGSRIPIYHPDKIKETKPDYVLILPWNIKNEIMEQMSFIRQWGGKFVIPIPKVNVL